MGHAYQPDFSLSRDRHLFSPGPKRILALDGGGIRGLISLGILSRIEETLAAESSDPHNFRLAHYFDLIAGTSTGSIIATALALGWSVRKVKALYEELGPTLFPPTRTMGILKFRRKASELDRVLRSSLGDMTLDSERFGFKEDVAKYGWPVVSVRRLPSPPPGVHRTPRPDVDSSDRGLGHHLPRRARFDTVRRSDDRPVRRQHVMCVVVGSR